MFSVQRPLTKDAAASEALSEVNRAFDGLVDHPNLVVSLASIAVAIPYSIFQQTAGGIRGLSAGKYQTADAQVTAATRGSRPAAEVAQAVAKTLVQRSSEAVVLLDKPRAEGEQIALAQPAASKLTPVSWPGEAPAITRAGSKVLRIEVLSAALTGEGTVNPSLAINVEARATLLRGKDGSELYSCPVHYRSPARKYTAWAAKDAKLFREELQRCHQQLSATVTNQLVARRLLAPSDYPDTLLANRN